MIHAQAPMRILKQTIHQTDPWNAFGDKTFSDFVNRRCSHLVLTMANDIRTNRGGVPQAQSLTAKIDEFDVPVVIFGLGVRAPSNDLNEVWLAPETISLLQYLERRCGPIGVRGAFTESVFRKCAGLTDVVVTGCPSFFSAPAAFRELRTNLSSPKPGVHSFAATRYERTEDLALFARTVSEGGFYIEATNEHNHAAHVQAMRGERVDVPDFMRQVFHEDAASQKFRREKPTTSGFTRTQLEEFYRSRYRLFRHPEEWTQFNREVISFSYGTRFHVNMAALLAGIPATWITHDTRTLEFCALLGLPHVDLADSTDMSVEDFRAAADFELMFERLPALFANWADYLQAHGLEYSVPTDLI
ncbi:MAG: polysaccharide pyruvyl transferase family protein [Ornithinimicrobium sp.]